MALDSSSLDLVFPRFRRSRLLPASLATAVLSKPRYGSAIPYAPRCWLSRGIAGETTATRIECSADTSYYFYPIPVSRLYRESEAEGSLPAEAAGAAMAVVSRA